MPPVVTALARYPVKSCRGQSLLEAAVEPWGLAGDRRWMVVDADGFVITAREVHRLLLVVPEVTDRGLTLTGPGLAPLEMPAPDGTLSTTVDVWGSRVEAASAGAAAAQWFTELVGQPARLVHLDDPTRRATDPRYTRPSDRVSFADAFPLLLTSEASLAALNEYIAAGPRSAEGPLPMTRFRPNVVVDGVDAWDEDCWRHVRIGATTFRAVKGCDRCVMTTLDPQTAAKGMEPIATLARQRKWDGKTWFGINLVPDTPLGRVRVGDQVEVLAAGDPGAGPLR
ncbi:MAG TPA: MOSC N-terminal beta barrel domain-containing protein [Jatrophihabitans sp.]|uniref:MOSC domain-containing protein n=1 Tax=Jatrophihabitans sp. TaxID=1932789 RepID=UPI002E020EF6|nr:MOSC N-terminal beta barrel domain-containing protein [Jatrophihabitans sp.]